MNKTFNIYCDESCCLENDGINVMSIGAIWIGEEKAKEAMQRIKEIKRKNGLNPNYELKWTKISPNHYKVYMDVIDYFFDDNDLHFRGVIIPDKSLLKHSYFCQTHDLLYYKMFFILLKVILDPHGKYNIYMDYKDTQGSKKINKLHEVLCNNYYDFSRQIISKIQLVKSHQVSLIQLCDIITGSLTYLHRWLDTNAGKNKIINRIKQRSEYNLMHTTLYKEQKMNILIWRPDESEEWI
jgi:hypothetical protein